MNIDFNLIKKLRLKSGIGIMDCKQALMDANGNIDDAIIILKKRGRIKAENKVKNTAMKGVVSTLIKEHCGYILELNCETDFVEKHDEFINFSNKVLSTIHDKQLDDLCELNEIFRDNRFDLIAKFGENIVIRRFKKLIGDNIISYIHGTRIGVLLHAKYNDKKLIRQIAMHIASNNPEYVQYQDVPNIIIENEKKIQLDIALRSGKSYNIANKIVQGRIEKFIEQICLFNQNFIFDTEKKIKNIIDNNKIEILDFIRFELGEEL